MARIVWCSYCKRDQPAELNEDGFTCCSFCGKVISQALYSDEPTFVKNAAGQSQLGGNYVKSVQSEYSASRERTLNSAYDLIAHMADQLGIQGGDKITKPAVALYTIALERNFTRGRVANQVAASCLYITCRDKEMPFLLIEFAEFLDINVYRLGSVFLQLCILLSLEEHPMVKKPVDPCLFIHRYTNVLLGKKNHKVEKTALRIMASMKRDWMQTGRKPSGLCGAALYISALAHGLKVTKTDIVKIVHVCKETLMKRLIEFEDTASGKLTIDELNQTAEELERNLKSSKGASSCHKSEKVELLCQHKGEKPHFAHGLCESCHEEFVNISGGLVGGAEPPAFQRAERERKANLHKERNPDADTGEGLETLDSRGNVQHKERNPDAGTKGPTIRTNHDKTEGDDCASAENGDDLGNFSDIDDAEVDAYLHNEEEKELKRVIWEEMNREYLQQQAAKEAAWGNCSAEECAKREDAAKSRKERRQKRAAEAKTPQTAAEAAHEMLKRKKRSSRINYEALKDLFDEPVDSNNTKQTTTESNPKGSKMPPVREEDDTDDYWGTTVDEEEDHYRSNPPDDEYYNEEQVHNNYGDDDDGSWF